MKTKEILTTLRGIARQTEQVVSDAARFRRSFLLVTLDSLRYDAASGALRDGRTPNLRQLVGEWEQREASATYTLPSHVSMFSGMMPRIPAADNRTVDTESRLFALSTSWARYKGRNIRYFFADAPNVPRGFESKGYQTVGVGGVGWFSNEISASSFWKGTYFQHFLYKPTYGEEYSDSFEHQLLDLRQFITENPAHRRFVFINVSSTHRPYRNGNGSLSLESQMLCLEYVDHHLPSLLALFPQGADGVICGDHGDCMGEDGLWGHNFVHEKVLTVPYAEFQF